MTWSPPEPVRAALDEGRITPDALVLLDDFRRRRTFPLDDFQVRAMLAILEGSSVIVSAPTGAGKTLVAEFAIEEALRVGGRVAYTTPLKALSNQKFGDFTRAYGADRVGILTGDVKVNPRAPVIVMTTEILRNMLYTRSLDRLRHVVLDECHYMGNEGRGTVWEEIIVGAPTTVTLVALSATVANVDEIADWIGLVHRPIVPVVHPERPVPLRHFVADLDAGVHSLESVRAGRARLAGLSGTRSSAEEFRHRQGWESRHDRPRVVGRRVAPPTALIGTLRDRGWLPAIYFIFSRAGCERALEGFLEEGRSLLEPGERREVEQAIAEAVDETPALAGSAINQSVFRALALGAGLHHAGILPTLKRLTERLFERGLCRVVFATETMSLGIHMPARSVVLQGLTKRTDRGFRTLSHNELTQMAGRAGRRGIDAEGQCVLALDVRDEVGEAILVVDGPPEPIQSQFRLGFGSVALLTETVRDREAIRRIVESSFAQYQNLRVIRRLESDAAAAEDLLREADRYRAPCGDFSRMGRYREAMADSQAQRRSQGRRRAARAQLLDEVEAGRLVLLRHRGGRGDDLGVVLGTHRLRSGTLVDALLPHGSVVRGRAGAVKRVFWATPPLLLPVGLRRLASHHRGWGRDFRETLARDGGEVLARLRGLDVATLVARERGDGRRPETIECHACPFGATASCDSAWKARERAEGVAARRREGLASVRDACWQEYLRVAEVLEAFGALDGEALTEKGRMISALRHDHELLVAEVVDRGILDDASPAEVAALVSCLIEEARSGDDAPSRRLLRDRPRLRRRIRQMADAAAAIADVQRRVGLSRTLAVQTGFVAAVFRWASHDGEWARVVEESFGGHEGDLIRAMRRLIDLLRQLAEAPAVPDRLARAAEVAGRALDREIVLESALI